MSDDILRIHDWLRDHEDELLRDTVSMLRIPSIESEPAPGAPFGEANREALEFALKLADQWGMKTKNIEGYAGYAEFGEGPLVMSLGHLDVVPVGPGWKHDPFGAEIENGYIFARGAVDDKGPTMASFYAARAIMECVPGLGARIRQVFGCNEESGFACVHRYMQTEEPPALGIAPDSMWPCVYAEKGICSLLVSVTPPTGKFQLLEVTGGQRPNIVIDSCIGRVRVVSEARPGVEAALADAWDKNITWSWNGDELHVESAGKAAHGSTPYFGDSAATRLFRFLLSLAPSSEQTFYRELFNSTQTSGVGIGISGQDEISRDLTCNLGIVRTEGGAIRLTFNVRYPVSWEGTHVRDLCLNYLETLENGFKLDSFSDSKPLYFKPDHPLVSTISDVCEIETGVRGKPGVMGGGTYARAIPNSVSVGTSWEGDGGAHETDEHYKIEHLFKASRIYAHMLYRLCLVAQGKAAVTLTTSGSVNE